MCLTAYAAFAFSVVVKEAWAIEINGAISVAFCFSGLRLGPLEMPRPIFIDASNFPSFGSELGKCSRQGLLIIRAFNFLPPTSRIQEEANVSRPSPTVCFIFNSTKRTVFPLLCSGTLSLLRLGCLSSEGFACHHTAHENDQHCHRHQKPILGHWISFQVLRGG